MLSPMLLLAATVMGLYLSGVSLEVLPLWLPSARVAEPSVVRLPPWKLLPLLLVDVQETSQRIQMHRHVQHQLHGQSLPRLIIVLLQVSLLIITPAKFFRWA